MDKRDFLGRKINIDDIALYRPWWNVNKLIIVKVLGFTNKCVRIKTNFGINTVERRSLVVINELPLEGPLYE